MRAFYLILFLVSPLYAAKPINWTIFPKVKAWDFENVPKNHANVDPELVMSWIAPNAEMRSVDRAKFAAKSIIAFTQNPYLRAVLMRDVLDAISKIDRNFQALDGLANNGVLFIGRALDTETRYALALSFDDGRFYRGPYHCALDTGDGYEIDFGNTQRWKLVE